LTTLLLEISPARFGSQGAEIVTGQERMLVALAVGVVIIIYPKYLFILIFLVLC